MSHPKSNSVPAELPSKLVTSGKRKIWSCNHKCVLAVLPPLVFISVGNCSDMYLLVRISHLVKKFPQVRFRHEIRLVICHSLNIIITLLGLAKNYNSSASHLDYHLDSHLDIHSH